MKLRKKPARYSRNGRKGYGKGNNKLTVKKRMHSSKQEEETKVLAPSKIKEIQKYIYVGQGMENVLQKFEGSLE